MIRGSMAKMIYPKMIRGCKAAPHKIVRNIDGEWYESRPTKEIWPAGSDVPDVKVPNPVELTPYRTFQEVAQPTSRFIFRMRQGGQSALFEADNSQWQVAAKQEIKVYLEQAQKQAWDEIKYPVLA